MFRCYRTVFVAIGSSNRASKYPGRIGSSVWIKLGSAFRCHIGTQNSDKMNQESLSANFGMTRKGSFRSGFTRAIKAIYWQDQDQVRLEYFAELVDTKCGCFEQIIRKVICSALFSFIYLLFVAFFLVMHAKTIRTCLGALVRKVPHLTRE